MTVRCLFFASLRNVVGGQELSFELPPGATVAALLQLVEGRFPALAEYRGRYQVAVDEAFADSGQVLHDGAEVALLPPMSGGTGDLVLLTEEPISVDRCLEAVRRPDCGAVVLFLGTVRDHTGGLPVERLEYSAYAGMALKELSRLAGELRSRWELGGVALWHRHGDLGPGDIAVAVAVSSAHRQAAFEAGRWAIDTLKATVPLWKREVGPDGAVWIEGDARIPG